MTNLTDHFGDDMKTNTFYRSSEGLFLVRKVTDSELTISYEGNMKKSTKYTEGYDIEVLTCEAEPLTMEEVRSYASDLITTGKDLKDTLRELNPTEARA